MKPNQLIEEVLNGVDPYRLIDGICIRESERKLPAGTKLHSHDMFSSWGGKLAIVFAPIYADDFHPETMVRRYTVHFVDGGKGKPLLADDWLHLVGKPYHDQGHSRFSVSTMDRNAPLTGKFMDGEVFDISVKPTDLNRNEVHKYIKYLKDERGFIDADSLSGAYGLKKAMSKGEAELLLSGKIKVLDDLYSVYGNDRGEEFYKAVTRYSQGHDEESKLRAVISANGIFLTTKDNSTIKFVIQK